MPSETNRIQEKKEQAEEGELPYISKSRLLSYVKCPRSFYYTYVLGRRAEETDAMRQGSRVHLVFETYYENLLEEYGDGHADGPLPAEPRDLVKFLPSDTLSWADWHNMIANFLVWELERLETARDYADMALCSLDEEHRRTNILNCWLPVGIEAEGWLQREGEPDWMGFADILVPSASISGVSGNNGTVVVDFKTGKTPAKKYRDDGIYLQSEYYGLIFESDYQIDGVAGYYPKNGDFLVEESDSKRRARVKQLIGEINEKMDSTPPTEIPPMDPFGIEEQPLCKWGTGEDEECDHFRDCSSSWGNPAVEDEKFRGMVESGYSESEIANEFGVEYGTVKYWQYKFDL